IIEADVKRNAIILRGSREQLDEVKVALRALGEQAPAGGVRVIPLERGDAATLAEAIRDLLPKMRSNPVRGMEPGKAEPAKKPAASGKDGGAKKEAGKAVTLTPIGNRLVVSSDDPQALAVVQELVRVLTAQQEGDLEVIRLQSASAAEVARVL